MSKQKKKGTRFETIVADWMSERTGCGVARRAQSGKNDKGDLIGLRLRGLTCCVECKDHARERLSEWRDQTEIERGNSDADIGLLVIHRPQRGEARCGENWVELCAEDFASLYFGVAAPAHPTARTVWVRTTLEELMEVCGR